MAGDALTPDTPPARPLRLASMSDLHIDHPENVPVLAAMARRLRRDPPDVLVVAGDAGSDPLTVGKLLVELRDCAGKVAYVPGNHDLWAQVRDACAAGEDTWRMYREVLPELCRRIGVHYLPEKPLVQGRVAFVGATGWYDFSLATRFARLLFRQEDFARGRYGRFAWADLRRTCFRRPDGSRMTDDEVVSVMVGDLERQLKGLPVSVEAVVAVTHLLPFREVVVSRAIPGWDYFSAYMGTARLGELYQQDPRVKLALYGHTHVPGSAVVGGIRAVGCPLGYPGEWSGSDEAMAESRLTYLEV